MDVADPVHAPAPVPLLGQSRQHARDHRSPLEAAVLRHAGEPSGLASLVHAGKPLPHAEQDRALGKAGEEVLHELLGAVDAVGAAVEQHDHPFFRGALALHPIPDRPRGRRLVRGEPVDEHEVVVLRVDDLRRPRIGLGEQGAPLRDLARDSQHPRHADGQRHVRGEYLVGEAGDVLLGHLAFVDHHQLRAAFDALPLQNVEVRARHGDAVAAAGYALRERFGDLELGGAHHVEVVFQDVDYHAHVGPEHSLLHHRLVLGANRHALAHHGVRAVPGGLVDADDLLLYVRALGLADDGLLPIEPVDHASRRSRGLAHHVVALLHQDGGHQARHGRLPADAVHVDAQRHPPQRPPVPETLQRAHRCESRYHENADHRCSHSNLPRMLLRRLALFRTKTGPARQELREPSVQPLFSAWTSYTIVSLSYLFHKLMLISPASSYTIPEYSHL